MSDSATTEWVRGHPFTVTAHQCTLKWGGGFWCKMCGHKFVAGDGARFICGNSIPGQRTGNFFVCSHCDGENILQRANESHDLAVKLAKQWGIYGPDWQQDRLNSLRTSERLR